MAKKRKRRKKKTQNKAVKIALILFLLVIIIAGIIIAINWKKIVKKAEDLLPGSFTYPTEYEEYVLKYSKEYNVDPVLIFSIIKTEFNLCRIDVIAFIVSFVLKGDLQLRFSISRHHPCVFAIQLLIKTILDDGLECPLGILVSSGRRLDSTRFPVLHIEHVSLLRDIIGTLRRGFGAESHYKRKHQTGFE